MPRGVPATSPEIKSEILKKVKEQGTSVPRFGQTIRPQP